MTHGALTSSDGPADPDPSEATRARVLEGALRSIARHGLERSSIASVAREARVSRQTIYAHFSGREEVLRAAVTRSAERLTEAAVASARTASSAPDFLVELTMSVYYGVRDNPAISAMLYSLDTPEGRELTMSAPILATVVDALSPVLEYEPGLRPRIEEIAETCLRLQVSLLTFPSARTRSPDLLRQYLSTALGPLAG